jgi:tellurite resistance protein
MSESKKLSSSWIFNWFFGFNQTPTNEDSSIYMKSVLTCAKADGVLSQEEKDWAIGFATSWGVADWVIEELKTYEANEPIEELIARSPQVSVAQRDILLSAIWVSAADGDIRHNKVQVYT